MVATTRVSSSGPTTSWTTAIRSYRVVVRRAGLTTAGPAVVTGASSLRSITVAMLFPPSVPPHSSLHYPCILGLRLGQGCDMIPLPIAASFPSGRVLLTPETIRPVRESCMKIR